VVVAPRRGEIYETNFNPARGHEQAGIRPALVVQNDIGNVHSSVTIVAAITSQLPTKRYPQNVQLASGTLPKESVVLCNQLCTVDTARLGRMMGAASPEDMANVDEALRHSLQLA
jgi:mRNA interferase MazF